MVANRKKMTCEGIYLNVTLVIQGYLVSVYFFHVTYGCLMMRVQWLATLGLVETDYNKLTRTIKRDYQTHTLLGMHQGEIGPL